MKLITLGTSHGATELNRSCSGNLFEINGCYYLFDCGCNVESKMTNLGLPIDKIKVVFISHMHEDHVGNLSSIFKRFSYYMKGEKVTFYLPEKDGITAFKNWTKALHLPDAQDIVSINLINEGVIYSDENVTVTAIPTKHLNNGDIPSYAFMLETKDRLVLYTGDLSGSFKDYPMVAYERDFDLILSELVHFNVENNLEDIIKSKTKKIVFTHYLDCKVNSIMDNLDKFKFEVEIAKDEDVFEI